MYLRTLNVRTIVSKGSLPINSDGWTVNIEPNRFKLDCTRSGSSSTMAILDVNMVSISAVEKNWIVELIRYLNSLDLDCNTVGSKLASKIKLTRSINWESAPSSPKSLDI
ncbi:hypothetical protein OGAPHI_004448 [Ogataea philodendri]|uniref:Uncharacterized protein n=1 Tax=Ogataea philodendri TaxID=1378263 RepID=A0A9P8T5F8_9ASCO|nr:uncharacterized protein OGAPHI_004448 [Ogataea philodendri]KAH3666259.1 hypothetical protein OGAPHI_004448 [Ogataea philodendri]